MLYLLGALGSLIRRKSTKFEKKYFAIVRLSNVNILILSNALKFEISVFFGMPRIFKVSHNSFGFPIYAESLSSENAQVFCCN